MTSTGCDCVSSEAVITAAQWLPATPRREQDNGAMVEPRDGFGHLALQPGKGIREAKLIRAGGM